MEVIDVATFDVYNGGCRATYRDLHAGRESPHDFVEVIYVDRKGPLFRNGRLRAMPAEVADDQDMQGLRLPPLGRVSGLLAAEAETEVNVILHVTALPSNRTRIMWASIALQIGQVISGPRRPSESSLCSLIEYCFILPLSTD